MPDAVSVAVNGASVTVPSGATALAAILSAGASSVRRSVSGSPRGPLCGMGVCFECRVRVDGQAHVRACITTVREGMEVETDDPSSP